MNTYKDHQTRSPAHRECAGSPHERAHRRREPRLSRRTSGSGERSRRATRLLTPGNAGVCPRRLRPNARASSIAEPLSRTARQISTSPPRERRRAAGDGSTPECRRPGGRVAAGRAGVRGTATARVFSVLWPGQARALRARRTRSPPGAGRRTTTRTTRTGAAEGTLLLGALWLPGQCAPVRVTAAGLRARVGCVATESGARPAMGPRKEEEDVRRLLVGLPLAVSLVAAGAVAGGAHGRGAGGTADDQGSRRQDLRSTDQSRTRSAHPDSDHPAPPQCLRRRTAAWPTSSRATKPFTTGPPGSAPAMYANIIGREVRRDGTQEVFLSNNHLRRRRNRLPCVLGRFRQPRRHLALRDHRRGRLLRRSQRHRQRPPRQPTSAARRASRSTSRIRPSGADIEGFYLHQLASIHRPGEWRR